MWKRISIMNESMNGWMKWMNAKCENLFYHSFKVIENRRDKRSVKKTENPVIHNGMAEAKKIASNTHKHTHTHKSID